MRVSVVALAAALLAGALPVAAQKGGSTAPPRTTPRPGGGSPAAPAGRVRANPANLRTPALIIAEKAREMDFGAALMPAPVGMRAPYQTALWQQFDRGSVYYSPGRGAFGMTDAFRAAWREAGGEEGFLGFPSEDTRACQPLRENLIQLFTGGAIVRTAATRSMRVVREPKPDSIDGVNGICGVPAGPATARFRVTVNGFTVQHQTWDHAMEVDGKGDEVYLMAMTRVFGSSGDPAGALSTRQSLVLGDVNGQSGRVQAGSRSAQGGLQTGDRVPGDPAWRRSVEPTTDRLPLLLWQGELRDGHEFVAISPTVWEWDGGFFGRAPLAAVLDIVPGALRNSFAGGSAARVSDTPADLREKVLFRHSALQLLNGAPGAGFHFTPSGIGDALDRPIGLQGSDFDPQVVLLTYDLAERVSRTDFGYGRGVVDVHYVDRDELAGDYVLYLQIERIP